MEIVNGTELEPNEIVVVGLDCAPEDVEEVYKRQLEIKDFIKRSKQAACLITLTVDDNIVMSLDVHERNPVLVWAQLAEDYKTVAPGQRTAARKEFLSNYIKAKTCQKMSDYEVDNIFKV